MLSRRNFMQLGAVAGAAAVLPGSAEAQTAVAVSSPAIAALKSMKDQARRSRAMSVVRELSRRES